MPPEIESSEPPPYARFGRLIVHRPYVSILRDNGLSEFDAFFDCDSGERLDKRGLAAWRQRVRLVFKSTEGSRVFYLKRYRQPPFGEQLRRILAGRPRESAAGVEWRILTQLADAGLPVPAPVAFGQHMRGWLEARSFLVMAEAPGESLEKWLPRHWPRRANGAAFRRRRTAIEAFARQIAAFHAAGFVHRDLYASHVFIRIEPDAAAPAFTFIDLQRIFRPRWRKTRWIAKDLAALDYSIAPHVARTDRLRFWRTYLEAVRRPEWLRTMPARIAGRTRRMSRHDIRRGRTLAGLGGHGTR